MSKTINSYPKVLNIQHKLATPLRGMREPVVVQEKIDGSQILC